MKTNYWLILAAMVATGAVAQDTNALPPMPAPVTSPTPEIAPAPAKKKKIPAPKKLVEPTVALVPGAAEVAVKNLNVRGQAGLKGEFLTHLSKGDAVTVLSQINLDKHKVGEPAQWAKIAFPASAHVWVRAQFIEATNKTVLPKKLNMRAGPGENYSVLGVLERGVAVSEIITKGEWTQIDPPTNAYAFVAAMYLKQAASGTLVTNPAPSTETEPAPTNTPVAELQPIVTEPASPPPTDTNTPTPAPAAVETNIPAPMVDTNLPPPPPRVVTHEGTVRHVNSIIEPTDYELFDPKTGVPINYLYTTTTNLDLSRYNGLHIIVTGEEGMAERWKDTPVLTIQRIQVVEP